MNSGRRYEDDSGSEGQAGIIINFLIIKKSGPAYRKASRNNANNAVPYLQLQIFLHPSDAVAVAFSISEYKASYLGTPFGLPSFLLDALPFCAYHEENERRRRFR